MPLDGPFLLDGRKLTSYLLSHADDHRAAKARFFEARGFSVDDLETIKAALLRHPQDNEVVASEVTQYGPKFVVSCSIATPDGKNPCITTVWMHDAEVGIYRFVSAVPRQAKIAMAAPDQP